MTISYSDNIIKLLLRWDGSVWKAVCKELFVWLLLFYTVRLIMMYALTDSELVKNIVEMFHQYESDLTVEFTLSFYVAQVVVRWWSQVLTMPWPDETIQLFSAYVNGADDSSRFLRYTLGRYLVLSQCLALRQVSDRVRARLPTLQHVIRLNLMTNSEWTAYKNAPPQLRWQLPLFWAQFLVVEDAIDCSGEKLSPPVQTTIVQELNKYRSALRTLLTYNWINMPLLYTQATGIYAYGYFAFCIIGEQYPGKKFSMPFPVSIVLEFVFFIGWYKVALGLMKPFSVGDNDVETNYIIDRHLKIVQSMADSMNSPKLIEDPFSNSENNDHLPYTKLAAKIEDKAPKLHAGFKAKSEFLQYFQQDTLNTFATENRENILFF